MSPTATRTMRHPQATTTLIMGLISTVLPVVGPFVWYYGQRMLADIDRSMVPIEGRGTIAAGRTLGVIATVAWLGIPIALFGYSVVGPG